MTMETQDDGVFDHNEADVTIVSYVLKCANNGKISALNTLLAHDYPGLADVLGEVGTSHTDLVEAAKPFFAALYRLLPGIDGVFPIQTFHQEEEKSQSDGPTSIICQPVCAACSSANYAVESSRPSKTT